MIPALFRKLEADGALLYTLLAAAVTSIAGPLVLLLVATRFSPMEQGYYYTFAALAGLTIFVELGVAQTVSITTAHLATRLELNEAGVLTGPAEALNELSAHLRYYLLWYLGAGLVAFLLLTGAGAWVLALRHEAVSWFWPWMVMSAGVALGLPLFPLQLFLYGLGLVKRVLFWRLIAVVTRFSFLAAAIVCNLGLFAQGLSLLAVAGAGAILPFIFLPLWRQLLSLPDIEIAAAAKSSLGFQWKVAVSWICGYASMYLLTPLLFRLVDPEAAGRYGATYSLANAAVTVGLAWINVNIPKLSGMISRQDTAGYRHLSGKLLLLSGGGGFLCLLLLALLYAGASWQQAKILDRFLSLQDLFLLGTSCWCYMEFGVLASLLRCFRSEPLLYEAAAGVVLLVVLPLILIPSWGVRGAVAGHLIASTVILVAAAIHFRSFVSSWQLECSSSI